jgi:hypothetical protein
MENDPKLEDIYRLALDTNRTIHKMRRSMLWGRFFYILVWLVLILGPAAAYYFYFQSYVQPYMTKIQQFEAQLQAANKQTQTYQSEISGFFGNIAQQLGSSTSATTTH